LLNETVSRLIKRSKEADEESGTKILYLALGFLKWYSREDGKEKYAPLVLKPIALKKGKGLVWGAAEGALFAGLLFILGTLYQSEWETMQFVRAGLVLLMGVLGGILGMLRAERKRR